MSASRLRTKLLGSTKSVLCGALGTVSLASFPLYAAVEHKVVGYIPAYRDMATVMNTTDLSRLTHINLSFMNPTASGAVMSGGNPLCLPGPDQSVSVRGSEIKALVQRAHEHGVKVLVSVAGGVIPGCSGDWARLLQPGSRKAIVNNLMAFVKYYNLDGLDVDIEGELLTSIDRAGNYTPFIKELRSALPKGKLLTSATASYVGGMVPTSSLPYFDFVNIMSYDDLGPSWGTPGIEHSPYAKAVADIEIWKARGLTREKMVLGVPFYGYGFGSYAQDYDFAQIVTQFGANAVQNDLIGTLCAGCDYVTYNGIPTIRKKTQLAMQEGAGVMIWELAQDAPGNNSLLATIGNQLGGAAGSASRTIQAESYANMGGVSVEKTSDVGGGKNVHSIDANDWMSYSNIHAPSAGTYKVEYRVSSVSGSRLSLDLNAGATQLGQVTIPATGGRQKWTTVSHNVELPAGTFNLGIYAPQGGWSLNWIRITKQ